MGIQVGHQTFSTKISICQTLDKLTGQSVQTACRSEHIECILPLCTDPSESSTTTCCTTFAIPDTHSVPPAILFPDVYLRLHMITRYHVCFTFPSLKVSCDSLAVNKLAMLLYPGNASPGLVPLAVWGWQLFCFDQLLSLQLETRDGMVSL